MVKYVMITVFSGILSAFSQILLKKSSNIEHDSIIKEYLNQYVIIGYGITFCCMLLMIVAYKGLPYKYGAILESLVYVYIMVLSRIFLKEKLSTKRVIGNLIIVSGVIVFYL